jgi:ABC-2 type transport system permease protein
MKQYKLSGSTAVGVILITYFLSIVVSLDSKLDFLKYFTPFKYYDASQFFRTGHFDLVYMLLSAAIIVICVGVAYFTYNHRDLYI